MYTLYIFNNSVPISDKPRRNAVTNIRDLVMFILWMNWSTHVKEVTTHFMSKQVVQLPHSHKGALWHRTPVFLRQVQRGDGSLFIKQQSFNINEYTRLKSLLDRISFWFFLASDLPHVDFSFETISWEFVRRISLTKRVFKVPKMSGSMANVRLTGNLKCGPQTHLVYSYLFIPL